jgi:hypothetical protein
MQLKALQKMVMRDTQYLMYYLKKTKEDIALYNDFCSNEKLILDKEEFIDGVWKDYAIDLYPYLYTINNITSNEFKGFLIYFIQHALAVDINVSKVRQIFYEDNNNIDNNLDMFYSIIMGDKVILISILSVMQYYFI